MLTQDHDFTILFNKYAKKIKKILYFLDLFLEN